MKKLYLFFLSLPVFLGASSQSRDASFNGTGVATVDFFKGNTQYETDSKVFPQKDGSFIVLFQVNGYTMYSRYTAGGNLDKRFGTEGFSEPLPISQALGGLQSNGKLVIAGMIYNREQGAFDFAVSRFNLDGSLDKSFGVNGYQQTDFFGSDDVAYAVTIQANDKIIVGGLADNPNTGNSDFALIRYNANGSMDNSFSSDGKQTTDFNGAYEEVHSLAVQSSGKIVAAGFLYNDNTGLYSMCIARYNANGTIDNSFDGDGKKTDVISAGDNYINAVAVQADGKIVTVGKAYDAANENATIAVARYNVNGTSDNSFSGDGKILVNFEGVNAGIAVAIQPDGKILAGGYKYDPATDERDFALLRFNTNGTADNSFNKDGVAITDFYGRSDVLYKFSLLPDGKIIASGEVFNPKTENIDIGIVKYKADGNIDRPFGKKGWISSYYNSGEGRIADVAVQPDGKIVVGGMALTENTLGDFVVARFNANGTLDKSFGNDGKTITDFYGDFDGIDVIALQPDGKIVALGQAYNIKTNINEFALVRYNADGSLDKKFGRKGKQTVAVLPDYNIPTSMLLQPDGKIVTAGLSFNVQADNYDIGLARFTSSGELDNSFDGDGIRITDIANTDDFVSGLVLQKNGKIVLGGYSASLGGPADFLLVRYNANGSYDNSFSGDGKAVLDLGGNEFTTDFIMQPDGKFVLVGEIYNEVTEAVSTIIARFNNNATPDNSFDGDGKKLVDFGGDSYFTSLALQPDGKLLLAGNAYNRSIGQNNILLARINTNGAFDNSFDGDGMLVDDPLQKDEYINSLSLYNNKVYVGGYAYLPAQTPLLARYAINTTALPITKAEQRALINANDLIVKAYPNPSTQYFSVSVKGSDNNAASLKVTDALGRLVEVKNNIQSNSLLLIGNQYKPGVYYVEVNQGGSKKLLQLIKQ